MLYWVCVLKIGCVGLVVFVWDDDFVVSGVSYVVY